jgi:hypothetical protein
LYVKNWFMLIQFKRLYLNENMKKPHPPTPSPLKRGRILGRMLPLSNGEGAGG